MAERYHSDTKPHSIAACARDRWLRRLAEDAIDALERRNLRACVVAAASDSPRDRLRRWLNSGPLR